MKSYRVYSKMYTLRDNVNKISNGYRKNIILVIIKDSKEYCLEINTVRISNTLKVSKWCYVTVGKNNRKDNSESLDTSRGTVQREQTQKTRKLYNRQYSKVVYARSYVQLNVCTDNQNSTAEVREGWQGEKYVKCKSENTIQINNVSTKYVPCVARIDIWPVLCIGVKFSYLRNPRVNPIPVRLKMSTWSKGEKGREDDVEMDDPAASGLIVASYIVALIINKCPNSCRAVISLDCNLYSYNVHNGTMSVIYILAPEQCRMYVIVYLNFIIWCGRYGE
jgi:hypothetical protein